MLLAVVLFALAQEATEDLQEWYLDFRKERTMPLSFGTRDAQMEEWIRLLQDGLRVTLPEERKNPGPVAMDTDFGVHGDFEITAAYEILRADVPERGFGVGVLLAIKKASADSQEARIGWLVRSKGRKVAVWDRSEIQPEGQRKFPGGTTPFPAGRVGRLRIKRTGQQLQYLIAEGLSGDNFQAIQECEFGTEDLERVALVVLTGNQPRTVDVRWLDLRIRATRVPATAEPTNSNGGWWVGFGLLGGVVFGWGFWWGRRRRKRKLAQANKGGERKRP